MHRSSASTDDPFVIFLRSVPDSRISPSGAVPRSYASRDGFLIEVKAIRSEYITMKFTAPDGRAVIALIPRDTWGSSDPATMLEPEDVRRSVIRTVRASKDCQMGVRVTNGQPGAEEHGDNHVSSHSGRKARYHGVPSLSLGSDSSDQSLASLRTPSRTSSEFQTSESDFSV
ncbi:hypothetical protein FS749_005808 [Ceratobasidium sp. UAMH 11750]|nr:hypothetical protein FS749_005808 [Ceratobasidium sp. UAMH 11750]